MSSRNVILSYGTARGRRITHDEADALLERGEFVRKVYERVITHRKRRGETVIRIWETADYSRRATTKTTYFI